MSRVKWSPFALEDVHRIYRFLATKNSKAAKRAVEIIRESIKTIALQPEAGRPAENMEPEYREWVIDFGGSGYIALYHYDGHKTAIILAVRHQKEAGY
jgi:plasmid stabilization system protein ParE